MREAALRSILFTVAAYYIAGRLGLLLAIPPGYATAVWPPSGIALAAVLLAGNRVWPGIWLGSFLVNVATSFEAGSTEAIVRSLVIASSIGGGAAFQAVAGAWLIRRFVGQVDNIITLGLNVVRMLLLGGPAACVINASVGVGTLWATGLVPNESVFFNWWTWWIGDSIGVLIFTPLLMVWSVRRRRQWLRQQIAISLPMLTMFAVVVMLFMFVSEREEARIHAEFEKSADRFSYELEKDLSIYSSMLAAVAGRFSGLNEVTPEEYEVFGEMLLKYGSRVQALSWNPHLTHAKRASFETEQRAVHGLSYSISVVDAHGNRIPAPRAAEYIPVLYTVPTAGNEISLGYDILSEPVRREAIGRARVSGEPAASGPVELIQHEAKNRGLLIVRPVYRHGIRDAELRGYAVVVIRATDLMSPAAKLVAQKGLLIQVSDVTESPDALVYSNYDQQEPAERQGLHLTRNLSVAGRDWRLDFETAPAYLVAHRSWAAWTLLAGGLLLAGFLGVTLLLVVGDTARIEALVKQRTLELQHINDEYRLSTEFSRAIIDTAFDAFVAMDADGRVQDWNRQAEIIFGWPRELVLGKPLADLIIPPQHRDAHWRGLKRYLETGEGNVLNKRIEITALNREGEEFPVELAIWSWRKDGTPRFNAFLHDISARKQTEHELALHAERLAEKNSELERFAYVVSHDLQAPLRGVAGFSELLERRFGGQLGEEGGEFVRFIHEGALQMHQMIRDILEFSRVGTSAIVLKTVNTDEVVDQVRDLLRLDIAEAGATIEHGSLPTVKADRAQLLQLFQNLIGNAIKFGRKDRAPQVMINAAPLNGSWHFQVRDNGIGVPKDKMSRLFNLFSRLHGPDAYPGSGLGLAICKRIVERHGGRIWVESEPGEGAVFHFTLRES